MIISGFGSATFHSFFPFSTANAILTRSANYFNYYSILMSASRAHVHNYLSHSLSLSLSLTLSRSPFRHTYRFASVEYFFFPSISHDPFLLTQNFSYFMTVIRLFHLAFKTRGHVK